MADDDTDDNAYDDTGDGKVEVDLSEVNPELWEAVRARAASEGLTVDQALERALWLWRRCRLAGDN
jgi:hypothetical protein